MHVEVTIQMVSHLQNAGDVEFLEYKYNFISFDLLVFMT